LLPFIRDSVEPGSTIHTDGWLGYLPVERVFSLLKRGLLGTHRGAVSQKHLGYYLDEYAFRFNRRRSKSRGKLFFRLAQQAVAIDPVPHDRIVHPIAARAKPQHVEAT
jgi:transposase-like protein